MIDRKLPLEQEIPLLALEVDQYRDMLNSPGFKNLDKEIAERVADLQEQLSNCDLDYVRRLQGQIEAFRWLRALPDEAANQLELLQKQLRDANTEDQTSPPSV